LGELLWTYLSTKPMAWASPDGIANEKCHPVAGMITVPVIGTLTMPTIEMA
jgi:hypothetical protein